MQNALSLVAAIHLRLERYKETFWQCFIVLSIVLSPFELFRSDERIRVQEFRTFFLHWIIKQSNR